jgi:23S rRNA (guanosine2251-2'-O)-methyltransferase
VYAEDASENAHELQRIVADARQATRIVAARYGGGHRISRCMTEREPHYAMTPPSGQSRLVGRRPVHVVLDNIRSAFNVGSIFRTADAGVVEHIHLCGMTAFPPNRKLAKTALGAFDYVPWSYHERTERAICILAERGIPIVGIETLEMTVSHLEFDWPKPVAIVFGHEVQGVAPDILARCTAVVRIPMYGFKNSINVATAFGVILYEIVRRWGDAN